MLLFALIALGATNASANAQSCASANAHPCASAKPCASALPLALPQLSAATLDDLHAVRALVDANQLRAARERWASIGARALANGTPAYGPADTAFSAHAYRAAFGLYDRMLFCGDTSELNPSAQDSGAAALLETALQRAAAGDFGKAHELLQRAAERDAASTESRYFLGLVELARGAPHAARSAWKAAIDSEGYAQPPDGWTMPRAQEAAIQRYLSTK
jgi:tetratricopeptide (TPR) repeat protein